MTSGKGGDAFRGFEEISLSRVTNWTYWDIVMQPSWFIEKLSLYINAENIAQNIKNKKAEAELKNKNYGRKR